MLLLLFAPPYSHQPCHASTEALGQRVRIDKHSKRDPDDVSRDDEGAAGRVWGEGLLFWVEMGEGLGV